ncbi:hypothetical protein [Photobacterium leiognathi]|uniref:hypothetical protein n=1 Tax=Photobacterium leiognathi TaxID=553611 RepID=UPI002981745F|nr:hypothetical protein [Photobacterium leiognathi]
MKKIITAALFFAIGSSPVFAGKLMMGAPYYTTCWTSVDIGSFSGAAKQTMDLIPKTYSSVYGGLVLPSLGDQTKQLVGISTENTVRIVGERMKNSLNKRQAFSELERANLDYTMAYTNHINNAVKSHEVKLVPEYENGDGGLVQASYFGQMCNKAKMNDVIFGGTTKRSFSQANSQMVGSLRAEQLVKKSGSSLSREMQKTHYENYCSEAEQKAGLCSEVSELPNADISSLNFLNPANERDKSVDDLTGYVTNYTYSEDEQEAAQLYIKNLVFAGDLPTPLSTERKDKSKSLYVAKYDQLASTLDYVSVVFHDSLQLRVPMTGEGERVAMSKLDALTYLVEIISGSDQDNNVGATSRGVDVSNMSLQLIEDQIDLLIMRENEKIAGLIALETALNESSISELQRFNDIR